MKIDRQVRVEAGHRCAIPTCRQTPIELAHIEPWAKVREHDFDNLIALCPNCHSRFDGGEIDKLSMKQYKANLGVVNGRYGDMERRVLAHFARDPKETSVSLPGAMDLLLEHLVLDGYLKYGQTFRSRATPDGLFDFDVVAIQEYCLTADGREFVNRWAGAGSL